MSDTWRDAVARVVGLVTPSLAWGESLEALTDLTPVERVGWLADHHVALDLAACVLEFFAKLDAESPGNRPTEALG